MYMTLWDSDFASRGVWLVLVKMFYPERDPKDVHRIDIYIERDTRETLPELH